MKKLLFYISNSIICAMFLSVRLAFFLFVVDKGFIADVDMNKLDVLTYILIALLFVNIYLGFKEARKN